MLNLLTDRWIPVTRRQSGRDVIAPSAIVRDLDRDPVIAINWPRPDFRIATLEFLIGLLATAFPPPETDSGWLDLWDTPPTPDALDAAFAPLACAFNLDGDGPRFMQDFEDLASGEEPVERLLIETPGDSTVKKNTDLLVHRDRVSQLSRATAAMALFTFQSWAPAGGAGNRTGLRGGGPLTTLIVPPGAPTLWHMLWANTPSGPRPNAADHTLIFPWLAPTITSEGARVVTHLSSHPLQCWWGMPRRIRLDFTADPDGGICDLTGRPDDVLVKTWRQRPRGANYVGWGLHHPLSPHYTAKTGGEWLPVHPQPGGIGYRHWLGLVINSGDRLKVPAQAVANWKNLRSQDVSPDPVRLLAAGYDMDNMKARGFVESEMPLPAAPDVAAQARIDDVAARLVDAAEIATRALRQAVRNALFSAGATVKLDAELLSAVRERLWDATERNFYVALEAVAQGGDAARDTALAAWPGLLRAQALPLFDEAAPIAADNFATAPRISQARRNLNFTLSGFGKDGAALFERLGLPAAETRGKTKGKAA